MSNSAIGQFYKELLFKDFYAVIVYVFINLINMIAMFVAWYMPFDMLMGACILFSSGFAFFILARVTYVNHIERNNLIVELLALYPVSKKMIRRELYMIMMYMILFQEIATIIPMFIMFFGFDMKTFIMAITTVAVSICVVSVITIEGTLLFFRK